MAAIQIIDEDTQQRQGTFSDLLKKASSKIKKEASIVSVSINTNKTITVNSEGIFMSELDKKGNAIKKALSLIPIYPIEKLEPYDESRPFIVLEGITGNGNTIRKIVPLGALASPNQNREYIKDLSDSGFNLIERIPGTQYTLAKILLDMSIIMEREGILPVKRGAIKSGWHFPEEIENQNISITQPIHIIPGGALYVGTMPPIHETKGTQEEWKAIIQKAIQGSPGVIMAIAAASGSYMRGWIDIETKIYHFHGASSLGKTLAIKIAASITGTPSDGYLVNSWNASKTGFESLAEGLRHGFICFDEAHTMLETAKNPLDLLMGFANNEGALRGRVNGELRQKKNWNLSILSTGNTDLTHVGEGTAQDEALKVRVIEIDISKHRMFTWSDSSRAETIQSELNKCYGHGYHLIIEAITNNHIKYKQTYDSFAKLVSDETNELKEYGNVINRRAKAWGLMYTGLHILNDILDISEDDINTTSELIYNLATEEIHEASEIEKEIDNDIINEIRAFVMRNIVNFHIKGYWFTPFANISESPDEWEYQQKNSANTLTNNCKQMLGIIEQTESMNEAGEITGKVYISTTAGKLIKECPDLANLAMRAEKAGVLIRQESQGTKRFIKKKGLGNAYAFDLGAVPF